MKQQSLDLEFQNYIEMQDMQSCSFFEEIHERVNNFLTSLNYKVIYEIINNISFLFELTIFFYIINKIKGWSINIIW